MVPPNDDSKNKNQSEPADPVNAPTGGAASDKTVKISAPGPLNKPASATPPGAPGKTNEADEPQSSGTEPSDTNSKPSSETGSDFLGKSNITEILNQTALDAIVAEATTAETPAIRNPTTPPPQGAAGAKLAPPGNGPAPNAPDDSASNNKAPNDKTSNEAGANEDTTGVFSIEQKKPAEPQTTVPEKLEPATEAGQDKPTPEDARRVAKAVRASMTFNPITGEMKTIRSNDTAKSPAVSASPQGTPPLAVPDISALAPPQASDAVTTPFNAKPDPTMVQHAPAPPGQPQGLLTPPKAPEMVPVAGPNSATRPLSKPPLAKLEKKDLGKKKFAFLLIPVLLVAVFYGAWAIDENSRGDRVARNTEINGVDISGLQGEDLGATITEATAEALEADLTVRIGGDEIVTTPLDLGATTDTNLTTEAALAARRSGFLLVRPFGWASSFLRTDQIEAEFQVDPTVAAEATQTTFEPIIDPVVETSIEVRGSRFAVVEGKRGQTIDPKEIEDELPDALDGSERPVLELTPIEGVPQISTSDAEKVAAEASTAVADPIDVQLLDKFATIEPTSLRSMVALDNSEGEVTWAIDNELAIEALKEQFVRVGTDADSARFTIVNGKPIVVPIRSAVECCDETTAERIKAGIVDRPKEGDYVVVEPNYIAPDPSADKLNALGITEEVSSFTTPHAAGGNRVKNIQRFADLMRGEVIPVGAELSLNEAVGQRTIAKGFFPDGAINQGVIEDQVGGGISQFATTFFNAAFFSGIEIEAYQFHTLAIGSRYPVGRESTISWPAPNVRVKNTSEHPILVWTSYTNSSITVTFYSQKHLKVTDVNGRELGFDVYAPGGRDKTFPPEIKSDRECRVYTTRRNTEFPDGEVVKDSFSGFYRPDEGKDCDGNLTPKAQAEQDAKDAADAEVDAPAEEN